MRVLVACEFSGTVRDAFRARGFDAWSCDVLPDERGSFHHWQRDVMELLQTAGAQHIDLIIAHPPCTYLANSGAKHLYLGMRKENGPNPHRWELMRQAAKFYVDMLDAPTRFVAVENPIMHGPGRAEVERIWAERHPGVPLPAVHYVQPHQHGHGETKATGFRLINLPPLIPTNIVAGREQRVWKMPPGPNRWKERSRTFPGIADAMAEQWGDHIRATQALAA